MAVRHGTHNAAHGEAVKIVVNKNQNPQHDGGHLRTRPGLDVPLGPAPKGGGAARPVHKTHHGPQNHQKHQNAHVVAVRQH
ncbi:hypothetical protein SDC9_147893 [bioreactor metagenome]|uniref:Uncharacterized protein n=1 Tax=bioreactor metagenome TaxID=1076179 RepID=A0A645EG25_9ZZZZ